MSFFNPKLSPIVRSRIKYPFALPMPPQYTIASENTLKYAESSQKDHALRTFQRALYRFSFDDFGNLKSIEYPEAYRGQCSLICSKILVNYLFYIILLHELHVPKTELLSFFKSLGAPLNMVSFPSEFNCASFLYASWHKSCYFEESDVDVHQEAILKELFGSIVTMAKQTGFFKSTISKTVMLFLADLNAHAAL
jgi:hypothetical protein